MFSNKVPTLTRSGHCITLSFSLPRYSLIWLHGLGDQPDSYLPLFTHITSPLYNGCRIILPQAPSLYASPNSVSEGWFEQRDYSSPQ